jgi:hypothetical protein
VYDGTIRCTELGLEVPTPCGPMTATATVTGTWTGHLQVPRLTLTLTRTGTWTMSGLQAATMEVEGRSHADLMSRFASASDQNHKELALASDATYQAITVDRASRWPISGDIHYAITGERTHTTPGLDTSRTFSVDALLTFHPDHTATLVLDGDVRYELDLEAGTASPEHD